MTQPQLDVRPFEALPRWLARHLRPLIERTADELLHELVETGHGAAAPGGTGEMAKVREGIVAGLEHFYDLMEDPRARWQRVAAFYLSIGRTMAEEGGDLTEMHQALRRSALAVCRSITAMAEALDLDHLTLSAVADAQFSYMDAVSSVITAGYEAAAKDTSDVLRRRKARLLALLFTDPQADPDLIAAAAAEAKWPLPRTVAAVVVHPRREGAFESPLLLPTGLLVDFGRSAGGRREPSLLVPDPDGPGRTGLLEPMLRDWIVAIGPTVSPLRAAESLRWARDTLVLARRGVIAADDLIRSADHVPTLVIFRAEELIDNAAAARLAPLRKLSPNQRDRLTETLLALLENNFNATEASSRLHVHPQTVRYRLRHLEELFGADLQDPRRCLEMEMILHAKYAGARVPVAPPAAPVTEHRVPARV